MNSLMIADLHKSYQNLEVLRGLSLLVPNASLTAILGASGSGKTTLLRVIAGFERAASGEVRLGGLQMDGPEVFLSPELRGIGYVSQDGSLFPHLSVSENVGFGLKRKERRNGRVEELLDLVGLTGLGRRFPHQLSGGEQQRVALARALAPKPRLILLDEPFSALDAELRVSLRADVKKVLTETGVTAILVTHDQDEALSLADQIAVLRGGTIVQTGTPQKIYERPIDRDLAQFVGQANFVDGVLEREQVQTAFGLLSIANKIAPQQNAQAVTVLIRPEQITVSLSADSTGLEAVIESCRYFGHDAVMRLKTVNPTGPGTIVVRVSGPEVLSPGTRVWVGCQGEAVVFPQ